MVYTAPTSHAHDVPGARLHYEVRGSGPVLMLLGLPRDSAGFADLAALLADGYTVMTYDPRGISRSTIDDPEQDATPELVADDVHRLLSTLTTEPAFMFGSSGGAVTGLALASQHPEQVHTLIAHEPPLCELLPDRGRVRAAIDDIYETYRNNRADAAWEKFAALTGVTSPARPDDSGPRPAGQDTPSERVRANGNRMLGHCMRPTTHYRPDIAALRETPTRIVVGGGASSVDQLPHRTAVTLADQLGTSLVEFPGDHAGFVGQPEEFARVLRGVLAQ